MWMLEMAAISCIDFQSLSVARAQAGVSPTIISTSLLCASKNASVDCIGSDCYTGRPDQTATCSSIAAGLLLFWD
jgi:hypothetical protein